MRCCSTLITSRHGAPALDNKSQSALRKGISHAEALRQQRLTAASRTNGARKISGRFRNAPPETERPHLQRGIGFDHTQRSGGCPRASPHDWGHTNRGRQCAISRRSVSSALLGGRPPTGARPARASPEGAQSHLRGGYIMSGPSRREFRWQAGAGAAVAAAASRLLGPAAVAARRRPASCPTGR